MPRRRRSSDRSGSRCRGGPLLSPYRRQGLCAASASRTECPPACARRPRPAPRSRPRRARRRAAPRSASPHRPRSHRAAQKCEIEGEDDRRLAADPPLRDRDGVAPGAERRLPLTQPLGVALPVAETERVRRYFRCFDLLEHAVVEQDLEARLAADPEMVAAVVTDIEALREVTVEQHLLAGRAFAPEVVRHVLARQRADLRQDVIGQPTHLVAIIPTRHRLAKCAFGRMPLSTFRRAAVPGTRALEFGASLPECTKCAKIGYAACPLGPR